MKKLWAWAVAVIAFAFWYDGRPCDDDPVRLRENGLL